MMEKADVSIQFQVMFMILTVEMFVEPPSMWDSDTNYNLDFFFF